MLSRGCTFDESTHSYALDGRTVPSVTRILDHAGLVSYDMVRREILERKSTIGTLVHLATKFHDKGTLDWSSLDKFTKGRTEAWAQFRKDKKFVPRVIEEQFIAMVNGMTYGMTVDREGLLDHKPCIVEIKTSAKVEKWFRIQTAGYALGLPDPEGIGGSPHHLFTRRRRFVVQLFDDGDYYAEEYKDPQDAAIFISSLHVTNWKLANGSPIRKIEEEF